MTKIVRRSDFAGGGITAKEKAQMDAHTKLWIERAMRTNPIEPEKIIPAIKSLYATAGLEAKRIIIVPSPRVLAFAGGFAMGVWYLRKHGVPQFFDMDATDAATYDATRAATYAATRDATDDATYAATRDAKKWPYQLALEISKGDSKVATWLLQCAQRWWNVYQGGNMWAGWESYLTAARDILGLKLPTHEKYASWEQCAIHGGFRIMHDEFCMISDFPEILKKDEQNRPHCENGPSHRWRDGWSLYYWHGVSVPAEWIEDKSALTPQIALGVENVEQRRAACEILGWEKILQQLKAKTIDKDKNPEIGELVEVNIPDAGKEKFLRVRCGTGRQFALPVPPNMKTALQANAWTYGFDNPEDYQLEVRT